LRNQIDIIWNDFWSGGLVNPLQVIEQITYLIFIKRLDKMQELVERKATTLSKPIERRIFPEGKDEGGEPYVNLRWSRFKHFAGPEMSASSTSTCSRSSGSSTGKVRFTPAT
jgi:type I restriction enzyme M protein